MRCANIKILLICLVGLLSTRYIFAQTDTTKTPVMDSLAIASALPDSTVLTSAADSSIQQAVSELTAKEKRKLHRDSVKAVRDSIRISTPRILVTSGLPDSLYYKKIISWHTDTYFNKLKRAKIDTTFNDWYTEYPFFKEDVNATYLGVIGSPTQNYNFFRRNEMDIVPFYAPYLTYSYIPETMPFYNTKTPHTVLAYWGTLFSYSDKEESSMKFLHTQNITPSLNLQMEYHMYGGRGLLTNEGTNNRTFTITGNYIGERYVANGGFISNSIIRNENGGVRKSSDVLDTLIDAKTINVNLEEASNKIKKKTFFISHSYGIPIRFKKDRDSLGQDSLDAGKGTMAYIGHYGEYSHYTKFYTDNIKNSIAREFYNNNFYIHPSVSADSMRVANLDNRVFIRLQPWDNDAIVSHIEGGVGLQNLTYYSFTPESYLKASSNVILNNGYLYAAANGKFKKYFFWEGFGKYTFLGYNQNDLEIKAKAGFSFYPFKSSNEGVDIVGKFSTTLKRPDFYSNTLYTNHYIWDNDFNKVSTTKIEGELNIPKWKLSASVGYAMLNNQTYFDTLGIIRQEEKPISVLSAYLKKDFKLGWFHLDNQVLFQMSSNQEVLPLPMLALHLRYYIQFDVVKNVMKVQIGADGTFNTAYYAPAYNPVTGQFHNQVSEKIGNAPYIDVFANFQWKTASIFLKYTNANQGWPTRDHFSAYHYIKPRRAFKVGIYWPFFVK